MEPKVYGEAMQIPGIDVGLPLPEDWRLARAAHVDLLLMGMPRVNLLLIARTGSFATCSKRSSSIFVSRSPTGRQASG
jgi:hypothetical protein